MALSSVNPFLCRWLFCPWGLTFLCCLSGVAANAVDFDKAFLLQSSTTTTSTSTDADNGHETTCTAPPDDDHCYTLVDSENLTETVSLVGQITVLFKFSSSEDYANYTFNVKMEELYVLLGRFIDIGYSPLQFVIIVPYANDENLEDLYFSALSDLTSDKANMTVVYETEDMELVKENTVTIIDPCARVVYYITMPDSFLQDPYVKAAILSAMFDQPCGHCAESPMNANYPSVQYPIDNDIDLDLDPTEKESHDVLFDEPEENQGNGLGLSSSTDQPPDADAGYLVPLRVIIPSEHVHRDSENPLGKFQKFNYFVMQSDNASYHGHLDSDPPDNVVIEEDKKGPLVYVNEDKQRFRVGKKYHFGEPLVNNPRNHDELKIIKEETQIFVQQRPETTTENYDEERNDDDHYEKIAPWLNFEL